MGTSKALNDDLHVKFAGRMNHRLAQIKNYLTLSTERSGRHITNNVVWTPCYPCRDNLRSWFIYGLSYPQILLGGRRFGP